MSKLLFEFVWIHKEKAKCVTFVPHMWHTTLSSFKSKPQLFVGQTALPKVALYLHNIVENWFLKLAFRTLV